MAPEHKVISDARNGPSLWFAIPDDGTWHAWGLNRMPARVGDTLLSVERAECGWGSDNDSIARELEDAQKSAVRIAIDRRRAEVERMAGMLGRAMAA